MMLVRQRLVDRLGRRWFVPVTVLAAPAGYGKTTLLRQAVAANASAPVGIDCWVACGPEAAAVSSLGDALCRAVDASPHVVARGGIDEIVATIVAAIWRRSPQQVALLVDDVHDVPPGSEAAALLEAVVSSLPTNGHVVLAGRQPPPLPLARLEVLGRVLRLDERDLAFTDAEVKEFAVLRAVPETRVAASGGWPALAELSASARSDVSADYVGQEVLSALSPAVRRGLALLAHLGPFDDDLARAVVGPGVDVVSLLAGIPLVTMHRNGERSLHSLWESLLAREVTTADVADARRAAAKALLERGRAAEAVRLLIATRAWEDATEAIVDSVRGPRLPAPRDVMEGWLTQLPAATRNTAGGRLLAAVVAKETDHETAWQELEKCAAEFHSLGHSTGELACVVHLAELAWWSERPERLTLIAARLLELEARGRDEVVPLACVARALLFDLQNDSHRVLAELDRIRPGSLSDRWQGVVSAFRATALLQLGNVSEALETTERALDRADSTLGPLVASVRLQALWYHGRTAEVLEALPGVIADVKKSGYRQQLALAAAQAGFAHALQGQREQSMNYLAQARTSATAPEAPLVATTLAMTEATLAVAEGDETSASACLAVHLARRPLGEGLSLAPQLRGVALLYVLAPETRVAWDRADLGPTYAVARDLARALVAVRESGRLPATAPPLPEPAIVAAHLPLRWVAELGVAGEAAGRDDASRLLDEAWPAHRTAVVEIAQRANGGLRKAARTAMTRLTTPPTARLDLLLLGPLELRRDGQPVEAPDWRRERVRSLLAYLVLNGTASREKVADDLWPALDAEGQSRNLRVTLTYLLRVLEPHRAQREASFFIRQHGNNLTLHPGDWLAADVWEFDALCERSAEADRQGSPSAALAPALQAIELWRGDVAELATDEWAMNALEQRRLRVVAVATRAGQLLLARGSTEHARTLAEQALAIDPWLEAAHRLVVASHSADGDALAARRALTRYREAVGDLGLSPDEATLMVERLLDTLPTRPDPGKYPTTADNRRTP